MKKALSLILGAMMLTSVVTGCSGSAPAASSAPAEPEKPEQPKAPASSEAPKQPEVPSEAVTVTPVITERMELSPGFMAAVAGGIAGVALLVFLIIGIAKMRKGKEY